MSIMNYTTPEELTLLANALAIALSKDRSADELNILGGFISSVGDLISLMASQKENLESQRDKKEQLKDLKKQMKELENE